MPRTAESDDDWDDDSEWTPDDDDEDAEWNEEDDSEDDDTMPCPYCRASVYEGAEQCPQCGSYLSEVDKPVEFKPMWIIVGGLICLALVAMWIWGG